MVIIRTTVHILTEINMKLAFVPLLGVLAVAPALAQQPMMQQDQTMRLQRMHETMTQMDRLMQNVRTMNQMMVQQHEQQGLQQMGQNMEQACERLQTMLRQMDQIQKDPTLQRDQDRMRQMDQLHDRLRDMLQEMDQARDALHKLATP